MGRSAGGFSTKLHAVTTTYGKPTHVELTPGQQHESTVAKSLLEHVTGKAVVADAGYDSNEIVAEVRAAKKVAVIASHPNRLRKRPKNRALYAKRYLVECFFHSLKRFRAIATRFEKTATNYLAAVHVACIVLWASVN